jgi:hypothetical protein
VFLWVVQVSDLGPTFVVDDPGDHGWVAFVLVDHDFDLAFEFGLGGGVW